MQKTNHINYSTDQQEVYCCLRNRVVQLTEEHKQDFCGGCKMFNGFADGEGVECLWEDIRNVSNPHIVIDPYKEWSSNQSRKVGTPPSWGNGVFMEATLP